MPQHNARWPASPASGLRSEPTCLDAVERPLFRAVTGLAEHVGPVVRPATVRRAAGGCVWMAILSGFFGCAGDSQPEAPDRAGAAGDNGCPNDLPSNAACATELPSYALDVAPIIEQRCATCHYPGNGQSGDVFDEYDDLYSRRQTVLTRVYSCVMPPEGAADLTLQERRTLLQWFVCGAPEN
jgi:hypothetical protein